MLPAPTLEENIINLKTLIENEIKLRGEDIGVKFSRKFYPFYISGIKNAAKFRAEIITENSFKKILDKLDGIIYDTLHS